MPKASLKFLAELYNEQENAISQLKYKEEDRFLDEIYDAQNRYDKCAREMATHSAIIKEIPNFARSNEGSRSFQAVAWHLVFLSKDTDILKEILTIMWIEGGSNWDGMETFHLLNDNETELVINYIKNSGEHEERWLSLVQNYICRNRKTEQLNAFISDGKLRFSANLNKIYYFHNQEAITAFDERVKRRGVINLQHDLLIQNQQKGWDSIERLEDIEYDSHEMLADYGGPETIHIFTQYIDSLPTKDRSPYLKSIRRFGNLKAFSWLFKQLESPEAWYRSKIFTIMSEFFFDEFFNDIPEFEPIYELYMKTRIGGGSKYPPQELQKFWVDVQPALLKHFNPNKRLHWYFPEPFDLLTMLKRVRYSPVRTDVDKFVDDLIIYTGQNFPFDCDAYMSKQEEQLDVWEKYLEDNREQYLPGRWVRFGKYVDEDQGDASVLFE